MKALDRPYTPAELDVIRVLESTNPAQAAEYINNLAIIDAHAKDGVTASLGATSGKEIAEAMLGLVFVGLAIWFIAWILINVFKSPEQSDIDQQVGAALTEDRNYERAAGISAGGITRNPEAENTVKAFINLNGELCAEIVSVRPLAISNTAEVICIEYRGGSDRVTYVINMATGALRKTG